MKITRLLYKIKPPCDKCPYTLGQVHTPLNPCPQCKVNGYETFERFLCRFSEKDVMGKIIKK